MIKDEWIETAAKAARRAAMVESGVPAHCVDEDLPVQEGDVIRMRAALAAVAPLIRAEEREAAAAMVRNRNWMATPNVEHSQLYWAAVDTLADHIAAAIRSRGDQS